MAEETPITGEPVRSGRETSEFKLTVGFIAGTVLAVLAQLLPAEWAAVLDAVLVAWYTHARSRVKSG